MDIERLEEWANTQNIGTANMSYHKAQEHVLKIIAETAIASQQTVCPECGGSGVYQEYDDEFDRYHVHACAKCNGTGKIARQSVTSEDVQRAIEQLKYAREQDREFDDGTFVDSLDLAIAALQAYRPWIPVSERKPKTNERVFLTVKRKSYFSDEMIYKIIIGCYFAPYEYEAENWNDYDVDFCDYKEENDTYYIKEGWFEKTLFGEEYDSFFIDDDWKITHWKPMIEPEKGE